MPTTTTTTSEPSWCQLDHAVEPGDRHVGRVDLSAQAELIVSDMPGEGRRYELIAAQRGETAEHAVTFGPGTAAHLAAELARLAGS